MAKTNTTTKPKTRKSKKAAGVSQFTYGAPRWAKPVLIVGHPLPAPSAAAPETAPRKRAPKQAADDFLGEEVVVPSDVAVTKGGVSDTQIRADTPLETTDGKPFGVALQPSYTPPRHHQIRYPAVPPPGRRRSHSGIPGEFELFVPLDAPTPVLRVAKVFCATDRQGIEKLSGLGSTSVSESLRGVRKAGLKVLMGFRNAARGLGADLGLGDLEIFFEWVRRQRGEALSLPETLKKKGKKKK